MYGFKALYMICKYHQVDYGGDCFSISTEVSEDSVAIIINQCLTPKDNLVTWTNVFDFRQSFVLIKQVLLY